MVSDMLEDSTTTHIDQNLEICNITLFRGDKLLDYLAPLQRSQPSTLIHDWAERVILKRLASLRMVCASVARTELGIRSSIRRRGDAGASYCDRGGFDGSHKTE